MTTEYIGQNEKFGIHIAKNEIHKTAPHIIFLPRSVNTELTEKENAIEQKEFKTMAAARKAAKNYLSIRQSLR